MRFLLTGFVLVSIAFGCAVGARPNFNNLGSVLSQLSQFQNVIANLDSIAPQINFLSSAQLQALKDKIIQAVFAGIASHGGINAIKDELQALLQPILNPVTQTLPQVYPTTRVDITSIINTIISTLPSILSLFGKRDIQTIDLTERDLHNLFNVVQTLNLNTLFPQAAVLLNGNQFQQLQNQFFNVIANGIGNHLPTNIIGQTIQSLLSQFLPNSRGFWNNINWDNVLSTAVQVLPAVITTAVSLIGKRDLPQERLNFQQLLSTLPVDKIAKLIQAFLNNQQSTITNILGQLRPLLQQFFPQYKGRINFDELAQHVLSVLSNNLSGLMQLFGKRDASQLLALAGSINIANLIPQIQQFLTNIDIQQLQTQFLNLLINDVVNHVDIKDLGEHIHALVAQFLSNTRGFFDFLNDINWAQVAQGAISAIPTVISVVSLIG